jgi:hypothetical protein
MTHRIIPSWGDVVHSKKYCVQLDYSGSTGTVLLTVAVLRNYDVWMGCGNISFCSEDGECLKLFVHYRYAVPAGLDVCMPYHSIPTRDQRRRPERYRTHVILWQD